MSGKLIVIKAEALYDDTREDDATSQDAFVASSGWLEKFMKLNGLSSRCVLSSSHLLSMVFD